MDKETLEECFETLATEAREFYLPSEVPVLEKPPSPLEFYREFVAPNRPVIIRNGLQHWPAITKWNEDYFRKNLGTKTITVAVTPNGYADAIAGDYFVMPEERQMRFSDFLDALETREHGVFYIQRQNSNFTLDFPELLDDAESDVKWATEAFGKLPDAVNFWLGDERAITSMHKDPYENVYCVVSGYKDFILHPPIDLPFIPYRECEQAVYTSSVEGRFTVAHLKSAPRVPWICIDPLKPDLESHPEYLNATPIHCRVHQGEMLYLPSMWFHHVQQSHKCIAVNYWYDMEFDIKYNYFKFLEKIVQRYNGQ